MDVGHLRETIRRAADSLGFDLCEFAAIGAAPHADFFDAWIDAGRAGEMSYLERNRDKRRFPALLAEAGAPPFQSMIVLGVDYRQFDLPPEIRDDPSRGVIASYAWGDDYHEIIRPLLYELDAAIRAQTGRTSMGKCLVDTGPVLERDWAEVAGLGFTGKNCCTIRPGIGSWLLLAVILAPEVLVEEGGREGEQEKGRGGDRKTPLLHNSQFTIHNSQLSIHPSPTCGRCTRCLDACPTSAFVAPYDLDPRRCISYWTIEARGVIPRELRPLFGNRIFGCDICQEVCPYNRRLPARTPRLDGLRALHSRVAPPLLEGFASTHPYWLDPRAFSEHFARSPLKRPKRVGMLRNVCVALGNWADTAAVDALALALADVEAIVRVHAAWALGRILAKWRYERAATLLTTALLHEEDDRVCEEIRLALAT
ncbi:MAG: epoxyqueuosine reductase [Chloroflexota bacterium]|nr:MAG: epoxyqueuosine reductase [Chloroflexota bacterium]